MKIRMAQYGVSHDHAAGKARVLRDSDDVDLVGVFEPSTQVRETLGASQAYAGVRWLLSKQEMLEDDTIDAIAVEGRVSENLDFAREALEHGKHVWLDKPAGDDLAAFREILELAAGRSLLVQLGYMFRYNAGFQFILDWAATGKLGRVVNVRAHIPTVAASEQHWARWDSRGERDGGIMFVLACHLIDIVVALLGTPQQVTPLARHHGDEFSWYRDNCVAVLEYPTALAIVETTALQVAPSQSQRLEVHGTRGSVILEPLEPPTLRLCLDEDRDGYAGGWQSVAAAARPRYVASLAAFIATIRGEQPPDRTFEHELAVQDTVLRAAGLTSAGC